MDTRGQPFVSVRALHCIKRNETAHVRLTLLVRKTESPDGDPLANRIIITFNRLTSFYDGRFAVVPRLTPGFKVWRRGRALMRGQVPRIQIDGGTKSLHD